MLLLQKVLKHSPSSEWLETLSQNSFTTGERNIDDLAELITRDDNNDHRVKEKMDVYKDMVNR